VRLRRQIPFTMAMELLLTARQVSAEEAREIGLIGRVVPDGTALDAALELAEMICANGPLAVEAIKRSVRESEGLSEEEGLRHELELGWPIFATDDAKEGPRPSPRSVLPSSSVNRALGRPWMFRSALLWNLSQLVARCDNLRQGAKGPPTDNAPRLLATAGGARRRGFPPRRQPGRPLWPSPTRRSCGLRLSSRPPHSRCGR
jgi:hypothetical protein